jgi:hypothetical protein
MFSPADLSALGHLPSAHTVDDEWDGCGCCGWCTVIVECSCGWEYEGSGTMTNGNLDAPYAFEEWRDHAREHIPGAVIPDWLVA